MREAEFLALCGIHEGTGIGDGDLGIGLDGLRAGDIADEEVVDDRNVHAAEEAEILAGIAELAFLQQRRRQHAAEIGTFVLLVLDGIDIVIAAFFIRHACIVEDVFLVRILLGDRADGFRHLVGAADDKVPVLFGRIEEHRLPLGRIVADFENLGLDVVAVFILDHLHALGGAVEERLVAERAIDDEQDLVLCLSRRGGEGAHRRRCGKGKGKVDYSPSGGFDHNRTPIL